MQAYPKTAPVLLLRIVLLQLNPLQDVVAVHDTYRSGRQLFEQHYVQPPRLSQGVPNFSWDKVPIYIHCQNKSGPLATEVAARFARRAAFVTIEKEHAQAVAYGGAPLDSTEWRERCRPRARR